METTRKSKSQNGKFDTVRNPFVGVRVVTNRPMLADCAGLGSVLDSVIAQGAAIMLGATRDGGALVITILDGDQRHRTYCSDDREMDNAVESIRAAYSDLD